MHNLSYLETIYIAAPELCRMLGVTRQNLHSLRANDAFPKARKVFGVSVFSRAEIEDWKKTYKPRKKHL